MKLNFHYVEITINSSFYQLYKDEWKRKDELKIFECANNFIAV